jgi:SAM-dependent methyltransferase
MNIVHEHRSYREEIAADTLIVNTAQAEAWNGYEGEHWAANDDRYDTINSGFNEPLLDVAGIGDTGRVLDVGCGDGKLTRLAARRARNGQVTGLDLSGPMLARALARAAEEGTGNVTFRQGDAQVYPLPPGGFDVAVSRFGVMFFADPVAPASTTASGHGNDEPGVPRRPGTGPRGAHWRRVHRRLLDPRRDRPGLGQDVVDAAGFIWGSGPVQFRVRHAGPGAITRAWAAVEDALAPFATPSGVVLRGAARLVTARRPGS